MNLQSHPSIVLWTHNNENELDPDGSRPFVSSSLSNDVESIRENDIYLSDVHCYRYFADVWDGDNYLIRRFLSEDFNFVGREKSFQNISVEFRLFLRFSAFK